MWFIEWNSTNMETKYNTIHYTCTVVVQIGCTKSVEVIKQPHM